mmetsp:Transcript_4701/g.10499  ORF Transcript_4701/g.10499 Transcript_4701/m.10499 type:complete len:290 (-) Transcript_4701:97-966(-)
MGNAASGKARDVARKGAARVQSLNSNQTRADALAAWEERSRPPPPVDASSSRSTRRDEYSPTRGHDPSSPPMTGSVPEMPDDLIKFLNDAGPLERQVDKELTSSKVYETLKDDRAREQQTKEANRRVRKRVPIMSSYKDLAENNSSNQMSVMDDGTTTERTTNFSTREQAPGGFGVKREDLYRILNALDSAKVDSPEWNRRVESEYDDLINFEPDKNKKTFDRLKDRALLEDSLRMIGIPAIMKDVDGDYIGVWKKRVDELKHSGGMKLAREDSVRLIMLSETPPKSEK